MASNIKSVGWPTGSPKTINEIINQITVWGVQRPNRYAVEFIDCPVSQSGGSSPYVFFATMVQIPQRTTNYFSDSVGPFSPYWDVPLKTEYDDHYIINFLVDKNWSIRSLIEAWMDHTIGGTINTEGYIYGTSAKGASLVPVAARTGDSKIKITGISTAENNKQTGTITLHQAWPKLILPTQFDTGANNQPLIMSVDFSYRYYTFDNLSHIPDAST